MHEVAPLDLSQLAQDLQVRKSQIEGVVQLLQEGNSIPFIARYRKELSGGLNEETLHQIRERVEFHKQLGERKLMILKSISGHGKLSEGLRSAIESADTSKRLDDLFLPFKPKKKSLARGAREKGLGPLAQAVWNRDPAVANLADSWTSFVNPEKGLTAVEDVRAGVLLILAEMSADVAGVRAATRSLLWETGRICSIKNDKVPDGHALEYREYFDFKQPLRQIPPFRILAINRGEKETALRTCLDFDADAIRQAGFRALAEALQEALRASREANSFPETQEGQGDRLSPDCEYCTPHADLLRAALEDGLARVVVPSLEREIRRELTDEAESLAAMNFGQGLKSVLMQPPTTGVRVLAIDPGFRAGCRVAALDENGILIESIVIHPLPVREREKKRPKKEKPAEGTQAVPESTSVLSASQPESATAQSSETPASNPAPVDAQPATSTSVAESTTSVDTVVGPPSNLSETQEVQATPPPEAPPGPNKREEAKEKLCDLVARHNVKIFVIGNGGASRESEEFVSELIQEKLPELSYTVVNEAGVSAYASSSIGREEFPDLDAPVRAAISLGRRLQDPLGEFVKIDPHQIAAGFHQQEIGQKHIKNALEGVLESCVNHVGVNVNTVGVSSLRFVSGLNPIVAREIVEYRTTHGPFKSREGLLQVPSMTPARFVQAAGFLTIPDGENGLDRTRVHPESYGVAARLLAELGFGPEALADTSRQDEIRQKLRKVNIEETAIRLQVGVATLRDIVDALARPSYDPREDFPPPALKKRALRIEDLQPGMELRGAVLNVVDFGAFLDVGLKDCGLVHISQMGNRFIRSAHDQVSAGEQLTVWVVKVDLERRRVSLSLNRPGSERRPPEGRRHGPRPSSTPGQQAGDARPPRGGPQESRGPRPQGRRDGPPRRGARGPHPGNRQAESPRAEDVASTGGRAAGKSGPPPRKQRRREAPRPKLSQDALEGKTPLRTFAELGALFAAKKSPPLASESKADKTASEASQSAEVAAASTAVVDQSSLPLPSTDGPPVQSSNSVETNATIPTSST